MLTCTVSKAKAQTQLALGVNQRYGSNDGDHMVGDIGPLGSKQGGMADPDSICLPN